MFKMQLLPSANRIGVNSLPIVHFKTKMLLLALMATISNPCRWRFQWRTSHLKVKLTMRMFLHLSVEEFITTEDKNNGLVTLNLCIPANILADGFSSSLISKKVYLFNTLLYELLVSLCRSGNVSDPKRGLPQWTGFNSELLRQIVWLGWNYSGLADVSLTDDCQYQWSSFVTLVSGLNSKWVNVATIMVTPWSASDGRCYKPSEPSTDCPWSPFSSPSSFYQHHQVQTPNGSSNMAQ